MPRKPVNWHTDAKVSLSKWGWRITKRDGKTVLTAARYHTMRGASMALENLRRSA